MHTISFLLAAYALGCLAAVPAGPVQIEVVRRSVNGHLFSSFAVVAGAFLADMAYGVVALFGIAPFLWEEKVMALFWLFGGLILSVLGFIIIKKSMQQPGSGLDREQKTKKRWGFVTGLSLSVINPVMILWWLSGVRILRDFGLVTELRSDTAFAVILAGSFGLGSYLLFLSVFIYWAKKFISARRIRQINIFFGGLLMLLALYFIVSSVRYMFST